VSWLWLVALVVWAVAIGMTIGAYREALRFKREAERLVEELEQALAWERVASHRNFDRGLTHYWRKPRDPS
jgi:hypothetical protein